MLRLNDTHATPLIAKAANVSYVAGSDVSIGHYDKKDRLTSGVFFSQSNGFSSLVHVASFRPNWMTKELLWFTFFYAFSVRKWEKLFGLVPDDGRHEAAMVMDLHLGFTQEAYLADVTARGEGVNVLSMLKEDCRWLNMKPPKVVFPDSDHTTIIEPNEANSLELS